MRRAAVIANALVAAEPRLVRRIALIGSRARGDERNDSDFDVCVIIEPPRVQWRATDNLSVKTRLIAAIASLGEPVELWVRTAAQFVAAARVFGGIEELVSREGVILYERNFDRQPLSRLTPDEVRQSHVRDWLYDALRHLELANQRTARNGIISSSEVTIYETCLRQGVLRGITALCVHHGVRASTKHEPLNIVLRRLSAVEGASDSIGEILETGPPWCASAAARVLNIVCSIVVNDNLTPLTERMRIELESLRLQETNGLRIAASYVKRAHGAE